MIKTSQDLVNTNRYEINAMFLIDFFAHKHKHKHNKPIDMSPNYNLGCNRCVECNEYHRLLKFERCSE